MRVPPIQLVGCVRKSASAWLSYLATLRFRGRNGNPESRHTQDYSDCDAGAGYSSGYHAPVIPPGRAKDVDADIDARGQAQEREWQDCKLYGKQGRAALDRVIVLRGRPGHDDLHWGKAHRCGEGGYVAR